jgi:predicted DNA-binding transcriptional regulator AlpA
MTASALVPDDELFLRIKDVLSILKKANVTIGRATFDAWVKKGSFPKPKYRFGNSPIWTMTQFKDWLRQCVANAK